MLLHDHNIPWEEHLTNRYIEVIAVGCLVIDLSWGGRRVTGGAVVRRCNSAIVRKIAPSISPEAGEGRESLATALGELTSARGAALMIGGLVHRVPAFNYLEIERQEKFDALSMRRRALPAGCPSEEGAGAWFGGGTRKCTGDRTKKDGTIGGPAVAGHMYETGHREGECLEKERAGSTLMRMVVGCKVEDHASWKVVVGELWQNKPSNGLTRQHLLLARHAAHQPYKKTS
ncbi:hypothetical protein BDK51DRAFT_45676 [Blyttiomyces helicus]|uniref:Uncharacterized protein n=1 Tax=Blyttiomyces helicus TaxID=388810 RepID=A0A4P9VTF2_9FUNG|nr:hypothetical protein BDK51DRAFT_45676 [Blyttiomyces helicus]|eukprot:RKO82801.1 hypothetical protein BDK51DRAFT_45676 [Blyttiomyces helicus]